MKYIILFFIFNFLYSQKQDEGMKAYSEERYQDARLYYENIIDKREKNEAAKFGLGASAFKQKDIETATKIFNQIKYSKNNILASKANYNLGNILREQNKLDESLNAYKNAIELNPKDDDAKINYELLKNAIEQQREQNDQQQNQDGQEQNQNDQQQDQDGQEKQKKQGYKSNAKNELEQTDKQMQAEAILDALRNKEKINQKLNIKKSKSRKLEKDW